MSKRSSAEERVLEFFRTSSLEVAQTVLNIVKAEVKARVDAETVEAAPPKKRVVRKRKAKAQPAVEAAQAPATA